MADLTGFQRFDISKISRQKKQNFHENLERKKMFNATFISSQEGVGKDSGKKWYRVELIAETITGGAKVLSVFCTESAYRQTAGMKYMQRIKVACGVNEGGFITINGIRSE